ncbi:hypothetical protein [Paenibacillus chitinolyticus]|nr:hypothetical protein [Paenibacillus chitinolyticus]
MMRKMVLTWLLFTLFLAAESAEAKMNVYSPPPQPDQSDSGVPGPPTEP